ncbi:anion permease [Geitlerinema splendidum]|jgi:DASS family divalent anion:Na+ symporter|nr:anion permease [Geitlerinema splendidum]
MKYLRLIFPLLIGTGLYYSPVPEGLDNSAWHLFSIFIGTIVGIILRPFPMGAIALFGILACCLTGVLNISKDVINGFGSIAVWLVVIVIFITRGFIKTNLGPRLAYIFIKLLGKSSLSLGYGIIFLELLMAPFIPSNTARSGGIIFPIVKAISEALGSRPEDGTEKRIGAYLTQVAYHGNVITSAMFLTAMAANPMIQMFAAKLEIKISWLLWAKAAIIPGIISIFFLPLVLYFIYPPQIKKLPEAVLWAEKNLKEMGKLSFHEWVMLSTFLIMLILWIVGDGLGIEAALTALLGVCILLALGVLTWDDILKETEAWHTLFWLSILVIMAVYLEKFGFVGWFSEKISSSVQGMEWPYGLLILVLVYFYSHYLFAGNVAHVGAMYSAFLSIAILIGAPPVISALILGFFSSLFSSMTHYATAPAAILFGSKYVTLNAWWKCGFIISVVNIFIWLSTGLSWWKIIALW